jgi:hypothetical protein
LYWLRRRLNHGLRHWLNHGLNDWHHRNITLLFEAHEFGLNVTLSIPGYETVHANPT